MVTKQVRATAAPSSLQPLWTALGFLGSLKFTVGLFASSIFLILIGTLAQSTMSMWEVIDYYFRAPYCWVELGVFAPESFVPHPPKGDWYKTLTGLSFPFLGGKSIGSAIFINLGSAYVLIIRRAIRARGKQLKAKHIAGGVTLLALGSVVTWVVINSGNAASGVQDEPLLSSDALMALMRACVGLATLALSGYSAWHFKQWLEGKRSEDRLVLFLEGIGSVILIGATGVSFGLGLDAPSLRILWQLIQGTFAGAVLLGGFWLLAGRKAGVLLIHFGVALLMFAELLVSLYAVEERFSISEGKSSNYAFDVRSVELAVIDRSDDDHDTVVAIAGKRLDSAQKAGKIISDKALPFDIKLVDYMVNAPGIVDISPKDRNQATVGIGRYVAPVEKRKSAGADSDSEVDVPAAYVRFIDKKSKKPIGTHLLTMALGEHTERVTVDDKTYDIYLRFKRSYKPYRVLLRDAIRTDYAGSSTPRDYASEVTIISDEEPREARIWMNNPLRYSGETLYQSGHNVLASGVENSVLQVVTNSGWMIPYVSCMLVFVGMFFHFIQMLVSFLRRKAREVPVVATPVNPYDEAVDVAKAKGFQDVEVAAPVTELAQPQTRINWMIPTIVAGLAIMMLGSLLFRARETEPGNGEFNVKSFGTLPVMADGRVKPLDTLARKTLLTISGKNTVKHGGEVKEYVAPTKKKKKKLSEAEWPEEAITLTATEWFLETISNEKRAMIYRVFRIENLTLLDNLGLPRRKGYRYSLSEFGDKLDALRPSLIDAYGKAEKDESKLDTYERKLIEFNGKIQTYMKVQASFRRIEYFSDVSVLNTDSQRITDELAQAKSDISRVVESDPPLACPPIEKDAKQWLVPMEAQRENQLSALIEFIPEEMRPSEVEMGETNPFPDMLWEITVAYREREAGEFNRSVRRYHAALEDRQPTAWSSGKNAWEGYINRSKMLHYSGILYILAFVLTFLSWLGLQKAMGRAALLTILIAFTAHSLLLLARIYISGRPPVTNLYSSAVFIGWGGIVFGLVMEGIFRIGVGNAVAAFSGFSSAWIASFLETQSNGDTMGVLSAVLDTQFWLATHVVLVTLGYTATFVAGFIGTLFILMGLFSPQLTKENRRNMYRMMYGTVCFGIFFSFIGTVLGGLWADDSWGRFWGWDPKENGALIIVLWNCLVLHARWGGMVKERGFANLCVLGNICTAWSWFGVNELGIGLHNYGFTEGVLRTLMIYAVAQMTLVGLGLIPNKYWRSSRVASTP
jgi:ABC-type transport system involved in cytochrome c biogenesis permease subunit